MATTVKPSPFQPKNLPVMPVIEGVRFATAEAGIRYKGRTDLMLATFDPGTVVGGVLTRSKTASAAVTWCRESLSHGTARALVVNSGNANTFTGQRGRDAVTLTAKHAASAAAAAEHEVYIASTGVIGEPMDASVFAHLLADMAKSGKADATEAAARAIMTTDTYPKLATRTVKIGDTDVRINGFCKGAGMIQPDMATMLCFIFTDAAIAQPLLQRLVSAISDQTFNCITVDGDTSTSDTLLVFATGAAAKRGAPVIADNMADANCGAFAGALRSLMHDLALQVVKDGEGLTKFVTFQVWGAESDQAARRIGFSCANSLILKTAIAGEDPNWGRVVMAVGKSGEAADRDKLSIWFGPHCVARNGERAADYVEATAAGYMKNAEIVIRIDVGIGGGAATVWTCDLTHDYVSINADYRS